MSFERKSHGWIRIRICSSICKGRTCMFGIVWLFLLAIPFLFCTCENHKTAKCMVNLENAWKVFQISQALQKQHQQNIQPGWWRSWRQVLNWKWWCWNTNNHHLLPKERWECDEIMILSSAKWSTNPLHGNPSKHRCFERIHADVPV